MGGEEPVQTTTILAHHLSPFIPLLSILDTRSGLFMVVVGSKSEKKLLDQPTSLLRVTNKY